MDYIARQLLQALVNIKNVCNEKNIKPGIIDNISETIFLVQKVLKNNIPKTIGFLGAQKRGKSSLINQLIGCNLMPVSPIPMSSVVIEIHRDNDLSQNDFAVDIIGADGFRNSSTVNFEQAKFLLQEYGSHKGNMGDMVDTIRVTSKFPDSKILEHGGILVDTPGAEIAFSQSCASNADDARRAIKILASTHIVIFVERADLMQSENSRKFFTENIKPMRPLCVINWKDAFDLDITNKITDIAIREECKQSKMREIMLKTYGVNLNRILCVSSKEARIAKTDKNNIDQAMLENSNLPILEKRILEELRNLYPEVGLIACLQEVQKIFSYFDKQMATEIFTVAKRNFYVIRESASPYHSKLAQIAKDIYEQYC